MHGRSPPGARHPPCGISAAPIPRRPQRRTRGRHAGKGSMLMCSWGVRSSALIGLPMPGCAWLSVQTAHLKGSLCGSAVGATAACQCFPVAFYALAQGRCKGCAPLRCGRGSLSAAMYRRRVTPSGSQYALPLPLSLTDIHNALMICWMVAGGQHVRHSVHHCYSLIIML